MLLAKASLDRDGDPCPPDRRVCQPTRSLSLEPQKWAVADLSCWLIVFACDLGEQRQGLSRAAALPRDLIPGPTGAP